MEAFFSFISSFWGTAVTVFFVVIAYMATQYLLTKTGIERKIGSLMRQMVLFIIVSIGFMMIVLSLPFSESTKGQLFSLFGIVISATFALSSTTFLGNALAGIMNRTINSFQPGDFIQVNNFFGRVSDRGLFHVEIQNEDRDLTTLPNLYLATNPVKVSRSSGTIISAFCSLGYDVSRIKIEKCLIEAAKEAGLNDPFVYITELGDFSVVYKINALLPEVTKILTARSRLRAMMLDKLHEAGIEIVSPNFMNQRPIGETTFIPKKARIKEVISEDAGPENIMFDKAEQAGKIETKKQRKEDIDLKIKELNEALKVAETDDAKAVTQEKLNTYTKIREKMEESIDKATQDLKKD